MEPTQAQLATYAQKMESRRAADRLTMALEKSGLLEPSPATAGGASVQKRIVSAPRWNDKQIREAFALYLRMLRRDLWLSTVFSIVYVLLIAVLTVLVALIALQVVNRQFSYRQLAGLPLPVLIQLLFRAQRRERDNSSKMRSDHTRALILTSSERTSA